MAREKRYHLIDGVQFEWTEDDWVAWEAEQEAADKDFTFTRSVRDGKLRDSDWTQLADAALGAHTAEEWATYRQELRDYPASASKVSELGAWADDPPTAKAKEEAE
jgi:hypothetical protein